MESAKHKELLNKFAGSGGKQPAADTSEEHKDDTNDADKNSSMETIEHMKSEVYQLQKLGFQVGATICPKDADELVINRITSINEETVKVVQIRDGHEFLAPDIKLQDLLRNYRLNKSKVTELLQGWHAENNACSPLNSSVWQNELAKSRVNLAMAMVYKELEDHVQYLELLQHPTMVKVTAEHAKGELKLAAATMKIDRKATKTSIDVGLGLHIGPQFGAPRDKNGNDNSSKWVCPFWLVGDSDKDDVSPNMAIRYEKREVMKEYVFVPVLVNTVALKAGDTLRWKHDDVPPHVKSAGSSKASTDCTRAEPKKRAGSKVAASKTKHQKKSK